jgi:hypothetical protein
VWEGWADDEGGGGGNGGRRTGRRLKIQTDETCMEEVDGAQWARCAFWEGMAGKMRQRRRA